LVTGKKMARMHSRDKGKSRSTKPIAKKVPSWVSYKTKEVEKLVMKLSKEGNSTAKIGLYLRDSYGIPNVKLITKRSISEILKAEKVYPEIPEDLMDLIRKAVNIRKHREDNHKDNTSKRGLQLTESKINRLSKYYRKSGVLNKDWKYDHSNIRLLVD
jgi:small subunit ribosomal protein S15